MYTISFLLSQLDWQKLINIYQTSAILNPLKDPLIEMIIVY